MLGYRSMTAGNGELAHKASALQFPETREKEAYDQLSTEKISDSIREVEVIGEADFIVSTKGKFFEWKGYGLRLSISEESLPTDMEECRINIKASLSGLFELPEDSELLSPVFWISALCKFKKPVTLEIQHCACRDEASFADLNFISANCSQKKLPYIFKQLDGGWFPADSSYGSIQLHHFSGVGITGRKRTPRAYCAQIYYTIKEDASDWRVYFIITKDLDTLKTVVGKDYCQETTFQIKFEHKEICLDIPENGEETNEGWRITPCTHPLIISKKDVDNFKPGKNIPPKCVLLVEWDLEGQKPVRLRYKINFIGAKPNLFNLSLNPTWKASQRSELTQQTPPSSPGGAQMSPPPPPSTILGYPSSPPPSLEPAVDQEVTSSPPHPHPQPHSDLHSKYPAGLDSEPELRDLMNEVAAAIPSKWWDVGLQLGLDDGVLEGIGGEASHCYRNVFTRWKNQTSTTHPYTWSTLVQALKTPAVGKKRLADKIRNKVTGHYSLNLGYF